MRVLLSCLLLASAVSANIDYGNTFGASYSADGSTLRTYRPGVDDKGLQRLQDEKDVNGEVKGDWTPWMDRDYPTPQGTGEFEDIFRERIEDYYRGECHMWCEKPIAMEVRLSVEHDNRTTSHLRQILTCAELAKDAANPFLGFICQNDKQIMSQDCTAEQCMENGLGDECQYCPNVEVRYFCEMSEYSCQPVAKRQLGHADMRRNLKDMLKFDQALDIMSSFDNEAKMKKKSLDVKKKSLEEKVLEKLLALMKNSKN